MTRLIASCVVVLAMASSSVADEVVRELRWAELEKAGELLGGEVQPDGTLKIEYTAAEPKTVALLVLEKPGVTSLRYAMAGKVRYEGVEGKSYLETWNHFPGGGSYFTRTLGEIGPMAALEGSSDWRTVLLPFSSSEETGPPVKLELDLVLAGRGTVYLSPLELVQYTGGEDPFASALGAASPPGAWWGPRTAGLVGGIAGSLLGLVGAAIGTLGGLGKARRLVEALALLTIGLGAVSFIAGLAAVALGQPYAVYYPLLLVGGIATVVMGPLLPVLRRRYAQIELRRMAAMDIGAGQSQGLSPSA